MKKALILGIPLLLLVFVFSVLFDTGTTRLLSNSYLSKYHTDISCLEYTLHINGDATVDRFCAETPDIEVSAQNIFYQRASHSIEIGRLSISILEKETKNAPQDPFQPIKLPLLPEDFPSVTIKQAKVNIPGLASPLTFDVHQNAKNQFILKNGWQVQLALEEGRLSATLNWRPIDFSGLLPESILAQIPESLSAQKFVSELQFDGDRLTLYQPAEIDSEAQFNTCPIAFQVQGFASADFLLSASAGEIDLSELQTNAKIKECELLDNLPFKLPAKSFELGFAEKIDIHETGLNIPIISVNSSNSNFIRFAAKETLVTDKGGITSRVNLSSTLENWLLATGSADFAYSQGNINLNKGLSELRITKKQFNNLSLNELSIENSFHFNQQNGFQIQADANLASLVNQDLSAENISATIKITKLADSPINFDAQSSTPLIHQGDHQIENLISSFAGEITDNQQLTLTGQSQIARLQAAEYNLGSYTLTHNLQAVLNQDRDITSQHQIASSTDFNATIDHTNTQIELNIPRQSISALTPLLQQANEQFSLVGGTVEAQLSYDIEQSKGLGELSLENVDGKFGEYLVNGLAYSPQFALNSAKLQLTPGNLSINNVFTGVSIDNVSAVIQSEGTVNIAKEITGELLGGSFIIDKIALSTEDQAFNLGLNNINLATLLQIQESAGVQGPGITVSGNIGGNIPLRLDQGEISIDDGQLANLGPGWLKIRGNAAFESLKQTQPEISSQLSVLENLQYETLTSSLNMQPDGLVNLSMQIQGTNPDVNEKINFNYSHEQNVFTLLKSLRLADEIKNKVDDALSDDKSD